MKIDLNCDLGESFGAYKLGLDDQVLPYISSATFLNCCAMYFYSLIERKIINLFHLLTLL